MSARSAVFLDSPCLNANAGRSSCRDVVRSGRLSLFSPVDQPCPRPPCCSRCSGREWRSQSSVALTSGSPATFGRNIRKSPTGDLNDIDIRAGDSRLASWQRVVNEYAATLHAAMVGRKQNVMSGDMPEETERLAADESGITRATELLAGGALVAFPTETVYGLGADARNGLAVAAIYEAKGRPSFNPLITHVSDIGRAREIARFPEPVLPFIRNGWPVGLTLVVPLRDRSGISSLVTAGQSTVALRVPVSPVAQGLLKAFGGPIAAPSANPSGRVSSTTADHVMTGLNGRIAAVLDGGNSSAGIESTIIGLRDNRPVVLREGAFVVPDGVPRITVPVDASGHVDSPGQLASHYAPVGLVRMNAQTAEPGEWHLGFGDIKGHASLSRDGDLREAATRLFALFHEADAKGVKRIAVAPIPDHDLGRAINDRLRRAAAPRPDPAQSR